MLYKRIFPGAYALLMILFMSLAHAFLPVYYLFKIPFTNFGLLFILAAAVMGVWAAIIFQQQQTTIVPAGKPTSLVTSGPYSFSRNPMYVSFALGLLGVAIFLGSVASLVFPLVFVAIISRLFVPAEEKNMEKAFGKKYMAYKNRVRRWL